MNLDRTHFDMRKSAPRARRESAADSSATVWNSAQALPPTKLVLSNPPCNYPWLTDQEVDDLCDGLTQNAAKIRYIRDVLKLPVTVKPNGRPLVPRWSCQHLLGGAPAELETVASPATHANQPNEQALLLAMSRR